MPNQEIAWEQAGTCPSCGVVTEHTWFYQVWGKTWSFANTWVGGVAEGP